MIASVVATETAAAAKSSALIAASKRERREGRRTRLVRRPIAPSEAAVGVVSHAVVPLGAALGGRELVLGGADLLLGERDDLGRLGDRRPRSRR